MIKALLILSLLAPSARAEFKTFGARAAEELPQMSFCGSGQFIIFTGSCQPGKKNKDAMSPKACSDVVSALSDGLPVLYPNASVQVVSDRSAEEVMNALTRPGVLGFFFVGEGDTKGGFITGAGRERVYPDVNACMSSYDLFGGFTSHSKYSPSVPAPAADRGLILSRTETLYAAAGAVPDSWVKFCKPRLGLVYPTRTFAGRIKDDIKKFMGMLQDEKRKHVLKTLGTICDNCAGHAAAGDELARFCPPSSNVCRARKLTPDTAKFILENYCLALAPAPSR